MSQYDELIQEIADSLAPKTVDREGGWFTAEDVRGDLTQKQARRALEKEVEAGVYEKAKAFDKGHVVNVYRKRQ
jgi:hypothetical protein